MPKKTHNSYYTTAQRAEALRNLKNPNKSAEDVHGAHPKIDRTSTAYIHARAAEDLRLADLALREHIRANTQLHEMRTGSIVAKIPDIPRPINQRVVDFVGSARKYGNAFIGSARKYGNAFIGSARRYRDEDYQGLGSTDNIKSRNAKELIKYKGLPKQANESSTVSLKIVGDKVQGVGLRKKFHKLLNKHKLKGLAVNDSERGIVEATLKGTSKQRNRLEKELSSLLKEETGANVTITEHSNVPRLKSVSMNRKELTEFNKKLYLGYLRSKKPSKKQMKELGTKSNMSYSQVVSDIMPRYLLKKTKSGGLSGKVTQLALKQLKGDTMPYEYMLEKNLVRSREDALKIMHPKDRAEFEKTASLYTWITKQAKEDPNAPGKGMGTAGNAARISRVDPKKLAIMNKKYPKLFPELNGLANKQTSRYDQLTKSTQLAKKHGSRRAKEVLDTDSWMPSIDRMKYNKAINATKAYDVLRKTKSKQQAIDSMGFIERKAINKLIDKGMINASTGGYRNTNAV